MGAGKLETLRERHVLSATGTRWRVREVMAHDVPGASAATCLIFDGVTVCRRLWSYPGRWADLGDAAILALMDLVRPER